MYRQEVIIKNICIAGNAVCCAKGKVFCKQLVYDCSPFKTNSGESLYCFVQVTVLLGKSEDMQGSGYNVNQSKIAIGSGGFLGKGFLGGTLTKARFVPERQTDFIFCTVGEEWGWVGSSLLVALYIVLLVRLISMAERQRSTFSRFYGYCVASILFIHIFVNIGMVLGLVPVIGIPLPFFSYGGSSMLAFTLLLFIFIRLDATKNQLY